MRILLRMLGTDARSARRAAAVIRSLGANRRTFRDAAFTALALTVALIDLLALAVVAGAGQ